MAKKNEWKNRVGVVYSTHSDYAFQQQPASVPDTLPPARQRLTVRLDRSGRAGKTVTLVTGFIGREEDLLTLTKELKAKCGAGGSAKNGEILIQGDVRDKVLLQLNQSGYAAKQSG